jgi:hypothetical protein
MKQVVEASRLGGTENQVAWAQEIRMRVNTEFDRVAEAFASVAARQTGQDQLDSVAVIALLEEKRAEVMSQDSAGYFIHVWQELSDQVRQLIAKDSRYQAIKADKAARSSARP